MSKGCNSGKCVPTIIKDKLNVPMKIEGLYIWFGIRFIATSNDNSVLLVEESGQPGENHRPVGSH